MPAADTSRVVSGRREPTGARGEHLEREHGRGHREPAHHHRVRGVQVRVAELLPFAAQVQRADDRLRQILGLQMFHDARLRVRQHSAGRRVTGDDDIDRCTRPSVLTDA